MNYGFSYLLLIQSLLLQVFWVVYSKVSNSIETEPVQAIMRILKKQLKRNNRSEWEQNIVTDVQTNHEYALQNIWDALSLLICNIDVLLKMCQAKNCYISILLIFYGNFRRPW